MNKKKEKDLEKEFVVANWGKMMRALGVQEEKLIAGLLGAVLGHFCEDDCLRCLAGTIKLERGICSAREQLLFLRKPVAT